MTIKLFRVYRETARLEIAELRRALRCREKLTAARFSPVESSIGTTDTYDFHLLSPRRARNFLIRNFTRTFKHFPGQETNRALSKTYHHSEIYIWLIRARRSGELSPGSSANYITSCFTILRSIVANCRKCLLFNAVIVRAHTKICTEIIQASHATARCTALCNISMTNLLKIS